MGQIPDHAKTKILFFQFSISLKFSLFVNDRFFFQVFAVNHDMFKTCLNAPHPRITKSKI